MLNETIGKKAITLNTFGFLIKKCSGTIPSFSSFSLLYVVSPYQTLAHPAVAKYITERATHRGGEKKHIASAKTAGTTNIKTKPSQ